MTGAGGLREWAAFAAAHGGVHRPPAGWLRKTNEMIELQVGRVPVTVEALPPGSSDNEGRATRWSARFLYRYAPTCRVFRESALTAAMKALGSPDVVLGIDPDFDAAFVVTSDSPALVRQMWTPAAVGQMVTSFSLSRVNADGRYVELVRAGVLVNHAVMKAGFELVASLAGCDFYGTEALRAVGGHGFEETPSGPRAVVDTPARIILQPRLKGSQVVTIARLKQAVSIPAMTLAVGDPRDEAPSHRLPQGAQMHLRQAGVGTLVIEPGGARFEWSEIETDPQRLLAGARLLGALTGEIGGVFR